MICMEFLVSRNLYDRMPISNSFGAQSLIHQINGWNTFQDRDIDNVPLTFGIS